MGNIPNCDLGIEKVGGEKTGGLVTGVRRLAFVGGGFGVALVLG